MTGTNAIALLPLLLIAGGSLLVIAAIAIHRSHKLAFTLTLITLGVAFASVWIAKTVVPRQVTSLLLVDDYALFYFALIAAASFAVALLAYGYLEKQNEKREELYVLLLLATLGSAVLVSSNHFASFFLGLEILSVSLYALVAYPRERALPSEAGIKYLVLAAASAAFLLLGMALVYAALGSMELGRLASLLTGSTPRDPLVLTGVIFIITGIGFKLAVVPFHMWTPDVYEGAPAPVAAFIATVSKGAMFALLIRYFYRAGIVRFPGVLVVFATIAIASMLAGNLLALLQNNVKRILAYSSIGHLGYLLVAFQSRSPMAVQAVNFYLVAYFVTMLGSFGIVSVLSSGERDADRLDDYRGLFRRRPILAGVFTAMLFSLAGIPLTVGFIAKFYVLAAGASALLWALVVILVISSAIGLFYYLRIIVVMYEPGEAVPLASSRVSLGEGVVLTCLTVLLFWFGIYPAALLRAVALTL